VDIFVKEGFPKLKGAGEIEAQSPIWKIIGEMLKRKHSGRTGKQTMQVWVYPLDYKFIRGSVLETHQRTCQKSRGESTMSK